MQQSYIALFYFILFYFILFYFIYLFIYLFTLEKIRLDISRKSLKISLSSR